MTRDVAEKPLVGVTADKKTHKASSKPISRRDACFLLESIAEEDAEVEAASLFHNLRVRRYYVLGVSAVHMPREGE